MKVILIGYITEQGFEITEFERKTFDANKELNAQAYGNSKCLAGQWSNYQIKYE